MTTILLAVVGIIFILLVFKYPPLSLALYFTTNFVKGSLMMNFSIFQRIDYTVLCAVFVLIMMGYSLIKHRGQMKDIFGLPTVLYLLFATVLIFATTYTSAPQYGFEKSSRFITLGLIAFLAPLIFGKQLKDVKLIIWILLFTGVILSIGTMLAPHAAVIRKGAETRASFLEASTLATAGKIAWSIIIFFVYLIIKNTSFRVRIISLVMVPLMIAGMLMTGSRGPLIGLILVLPIAMVICRRYASKTWRPVVIAVIVISFMVSFATLSEQLTRRISNMWASGYDAKQSTTSRTYMWSWTFPRCFDRPVLGHGTGAYSVDSDGVDARLYPHNMFLEVFYEEGVVGLFVLSIFLWVIFQRWRQASALIYQYGLGMDLYMYLHIAGLLFLFQFSQAMKSGDLLDQRFTFFCTGLIVAVFNLARTFSEQVYDEPLYEDDLQLSEYAVCEQI